MRGAGFILVVAVVSWLAVLGFWIAGDPSIAMSAYQAFSTYNTSPGGLSQVYGYLTAQRPAGAVRRLVRDIDVEHPPVNATIIRVTAGGPRITTPDVKETPAKAKARTKAKGSSPATHEAGPLLSEAEDAWVRQGGRLLIAMTGHYGPIDLIPGTASSLRRVFPVQPPLPPIDVPSYHALSGEGLQHFHAILSSDEGPLLARWTHGAGEVLLFSVPEALSNEYVGSGRNLELIGRLIRPKAAVYFDESVHGITDEPSIWTLLIEGWGLGPALVILASAALAAFWRQARPTGAPERPERDARSEAIDLVRSVGGLYDRAIDGEQALRLYYRGLVRVVHARTGLKGEALDRFVAEHTRGYDARPQYNDYSREEFQRALTILNHAYETVGYGSTR